MRELVALALRIPRLVPEVIAALRQGAVQAVVSNNTLVWVVDSARIQRVVPDAASGAGWTDDKPLIEAVLRHAKPSMSVLDLGCGGGRNARHVAPHVDQLVCVDASGLLLREARENLAHFPNVSFVRTDGFTLEPLESSRLDLAYAQGVFSNLELTPGLALLDEVHRVLRPGGISVVNVRTVDRAEEGAAAVSRARAAARRRRFAGSEARPYVRAQVEAMHALVGFDVLERSEPEDPEAPTVFVARRDRSDSS